jgi:hypothetical protein
VSEVQMPLSDIVPPEMSPRPFLEVTDLWLKIHKMNEVFFAREAGRASSSATCLSILILSVVNSMLSVLASVLQIGFDTSWLPPEYSDIASALAAPSVGCMLCAGFFAVLAGFYLNNVLVYVGARLLGGRGDFTTQAYVQSLYWVPIALLSGVSALVPWVGYLLVLALTVAMLIYSVWAVKAAHDLTTGRAVGAVLTPLLVLVAFACLASLGLLFLGAPLPGLLEQLGLGA